jgi:hypothetical protein
VTWDNPPHRSHLCHGCGLIWRPADVPTTGIATIGTRGKGDTYTGNERWTGHNRPAGCDAPATAAHAGATQFHLCTPKQGGEGYVIDRAPDSFELRECNIVPLRADNASFIVLIQNAINASRRGSDTYMASMIAAGQIERLAAPTPAATAPAALTDERKVVTDAEILRAYLSAGLGSAPPAWVYEFARALTVAAPAALTDEQLEDAIREGQHEASQRYTTGSMVWCKKVIESVDAARALLAPNPSNSADAGE